MLNRIAKFVQIAGVTFAGALVLAGGTSAKASTITARVDLSDQRMEVLVDGRPTFAWKVSTARRGYFTPTGSFKPTRMHKMWYSKKYDNAPMPHSVFFHGGYAVHATDAVKRLGSPASHGCVRLSPQNAADFYQLVKLFGAGNTSIVIVK
jgi:lipoprotein-anchoring transpeptidase ErfK/SrfK